MKKTPRESAETTLAVAESVDFYPTYAVIRVQNTKTSIKVFDKEEIQWLWELTYDPNS